MITMAIVGSRKYPQPLLVRAFVQRLALRMRTVEVASGGAGGVDTWAVEEAKACGLTTKVMPADWAEHGKKAGRIRNSALIRQADVVVAFWDGESKGTLDVVRKCLSWGKRFKVFDPDGNTVPVEKLQQMVEDQTCKEPT